MTAELKQAESEDRILLKKYIKHIVNHEGTDFLDDHCDDPNLFTNDNWNTLTAIRDELIAENEQ